MATPWLGAGPQVDFSKRSFDINHSLLDQGFISETALMLALPLTLIGVELLLLIFNSTLSMFSVIGVVMLMGLVSKSAILMTTLAMIFGMVPLAFSLTEGSEMFTTMGQAVIGGVITSTLLPLVVVPVVYCYMDDLAQWLRRHFGALSAE